MIDQTTTYTCDKCGDKATLGAESASFNQLLFKGHGLPEGWFCNDVYVYCPKHYLKVEVADVAP